MKTYNEKALEVAKRLSNLPKNKLFQYSKLVANMSIFLIFAGGVFLVFKREAIGGGVVILGIASFLTSGFNIFKSKNK
ncbi:MAG: hypothetical protein ACERKZ_16555 [Lachnotalea sp.]